MLLAGMLACPAAPALGAVTFRAASQAGVGFTGDLPAPTAGSFTNGNPNVSSGCPSSISPPVPGGAPGDLLLAEVVSKDSATLTPSAGWNTLFADRPVAGYQAAIYWRVADSSGNDNLTVSKAGAGCNVMVGRTARFSGVDPVDPILNATPSSQLPATNWSFQNSNTITSGTEDTSVPTAIPNAMLVFALLIGDNNATGAPAGFTELFDSGTGTGSDGQVSLKYQSPTGAGPKGPFAINKGGGSDPNHGVLFALRPGGLTINVPAGTQADDVMIASIVVRPANMLITPPAGWTLVRLINQPAGGGTGGSGQVQATYYRVATAAEPASYTWRFFGGVSNGAAGGILSFSGVDTANPIDAEGGNVTPFGLNHTANSITTTVADTMLVSAHAMNSADTWTPPAGMTEAVDVASQPLDAVGATIEINHELRTSAGATGSRTARVANFADNGTAQLLALRPGASIAGFQFSLGGAAASTCSPKRVTVTAVDSIGNTVTSYTGTVVLSTSTGRGGWALVAGGGLFTEAGTANDGAAVYSFVAGDLGSVTLDLSDQSADDLTITARDSVIPAAVSTSAQINFRDNAFVITATDALGNVPVAGRPHSLRAQLWQRDPTTGNCQIATTYNGTKALDAWVSLDPDHPAGATLPQIGALTLPSTAPAPDMGSNNLTTLNFVNGEADFTLTTSDVGKYAVNLRDDTRDFASGMDILGASPTVTVRPFALVVSDIRQGGATNSSNPGPGSAAFAKAGSDFRATVGAYRWSSAADGNNDGVPDAAPTLAQITAAGVTPRYNWPTSLTAGLPITPVGGVLGSFVGGALGAATPVPFTGGVATATNLSYAEVGSFTLAARAVNFLNTPMLDLVGAVFDSSGARNAVVGRFIPDHLTVGGATLLNRSGAGCSPASTYTYMDEAMTLGFVLTARNAGGGVTQNYATASGFAKLDPAVPGQLGLGAKDGTTNLSGRLDVASSSGAFSAGTASVAAELGLRRASPDDPDGPYNALRLGVAPQDGDGVQLLAAALDLDVDGAGGADHQEVAQTAVRFGRLRLGSAFGSELLELPLALSVQYWNGVGFVVHGDDSCTSLASANVVLSNHQRNLSPGETAVVPTPALSFASGVGDLRLSAPGAGDNGAVDLRVDLTAEGKSYLRGRWNETDEDANPATAYDDDPSARASFGLYKGGSQIIYQRESY